MIAYLWIALGGALGSVARALVSAAFAARGAGDFPWGTLTVNVTGSLLIGFLAAFAGPDSRAGPSSALGPFLMVGVCGGYTTFSAFSLQTLALLRAGHPAAAVANIGLSLVACLAAVAAGAWIGGSLAAPSG